MVSFRIAQQNVGRSITAVTQVNVDVDQYHVLCVQEPYVFSEGKIGGIPVEVTAVYSQTRTRSVVYVMNKIVPTGKS